MTKKARGWRAGLLAASMVGAGSCLAAAPAPAPPPSPAPVQPEWWPTGADPKVILPVATDPVWASDQTSPDWITDDTTQLVWRLPSTMGIHGDVSYDAAQAYCRGIFSSLDVYHVPTRHELESIIDLRRTGPVVDQERFKGVSGGFYWTSTPLVPGAAIRWQINLDDGLQFPRNLGSSGSPSLGRALCVANRIDVETPGRFVLAGASVRDTHTGLTWQRDTVQGDDVRSAADLCNASTVAGLHWRMPTLKELMSLLSMQRPADGAPYIDPVFRGQAQSTSSTPAVARTGSTMMGVNYDSGLWAPGGSDVARCVSTPKADALRTAKGPIYVAPGKGDDLFKDLQAFEARDLQVVDGDLTIDAGTAGSVILPYLAKVTGSLTITGKGAQFINLASLASVGGNLDIAGGANLASISMRQLASVGGSFGIHDNPVLGRDQALDDGWNNPAIDVPALAHVGGDLAIDRDALVKTLDLHMQDVGGRFSVTSNDALRWLRSTSLTSVGAGCKSSQDSCGDFHVDMNHQLTDITFDRLERIQGSFWIGGNFQLSFMSLQRIDAILGGFSVTVNKALCARSWVDLALTNLWRRNHFPSPIAVNDNDPTGDCATHCPSDQGSYCKIPAEAGGFQNRK